MREAMPGIEAQREAVRRMVRWSYEGYDIGVVQGIWLWATRDGMAGPLPPLPKWLALREQLQGDPEEHH
jgi:hypothetical protein